MAPKKLLAKPIGPDPKGWSDIRSAWSRHLVANQGGNEMETLRDFVVTTLADLEKQPNRLSPEAYARFFETMSVQVPWKNFSTYMQEVRVPVMISLGLLAERSGIEKARSGRSIAAQYMFQMRQAFESMRFQSFLDSHAHEDMSRFLQSSLSPLYKLRLLKEFASPQVWLHPDMGDKIRDLLPSKASAAFKFFSWDSNHPALNKELVRVFLPSAYGLLDLSLPESVWYHQALVAKAVASLGASKKNNANRFAFDLPSDFLGEP